MKIVKEPTVLTINGKAAGVMPDVEVYEGRFDLKEETIELLRGRLASLGCKKHRTANKFFAEFFAKNNIPTKTEDR